MKTATKIAALGSVGILVLLAVAGAALASGAGPVSSGAAYEQRSGMMGSSDSPVHVNHCAENQCRERCCAMAQPGTVTCSQACGQDCPNDRTCDGTPDQLRTQDQLRQMDRTCLSR